MRVSMGAMSVSNRADEMQSLKNILARENSLDRIKAYLCMDDIDLLVIVREVICMVDSSFVLQMC